MNIRKKKVEIPAGDRTMWEQSIFTKVWEFGKDGAAMVKKHYKNGLMLGVFLLAMFFLGRSMGAIAFGLHLQREMSIREAAGSALENTRHCSPRRTGDWDSARKERSPAVRLPRTN